MTLAGPGRGWPPRRGPGPPALRSVLGADEPWVNLALGAIALVIAIALGVWLTGQVAALLFGAHERLGVGLADMPGVLLALPEHLGDPARAWPPDARRALPGAPGLYGAAALVLALGAGGGAAAVAVWRRWSGPSRAGGARRRPGSRRPGFDGPAAARAAGYGGPPTEIVPGPPRFLLGRCEGTPLWSPTDANVLVVGPARSGKSTGLLRPNIARWPGGAVICSIRPEAYEWARAARAASDRTFAVFDPAGLLDAAEEERVAWWPWIEAERWDRAVSTAHAMCAGLEDRGVSNSRHFAERAAELLAPLLHAAALTEAQVGRVRSWVGAENPEIDQLIAVLRHHGSETAAADLAQFRHEAEDQGGGKAATVSTARRALRWAARDDVRRSLDAERHPPLDLERLILAGGTLVVVSPPARMSELAPLLSALLERLVEVGHERAFEQPGRRLELPFAFLLDELAGIAPFTALPQHMATGGGFGMPTLGLSQDLAQLAARWGREGAQTLWNNAAVHIITSGALDEPTEAAAIRAAGQVLEHRRSANASRGRSQPAWGAISGQRSSSRGWRESWEPALRPGELARLELGSALCLAARCRPLTLELPSDEEDRPPTKGAEAF